jgi:hypothetical protein
MTESKSVKERAAALSLSLDAIALAKKERPAPRSLQEALNEWANKPLTVSKELARSHPAPEYVGEEL